MLEIIDLSGNKFVSLPSFRNLSNLFYLNISNCKLLQKIPEPPRCLKKVYASDCKLLVEYQGEIMVKVVSNSTGNVTLKNKDRFPKNIKLKLQFLEMIFKIGLALKNL